MTKKLFTKYLPVEGEIEMGDLYSCPHKGHALKIEGLPLAHAPKMIIIERKAGSGNTCPDCYKVKLFLCSKDIQVGDKVWSDYSGENDYPFGEVILKTIEDSTAWDSEGYEYVPSQLFKVIGEVSPDATWVTEGMEFDEEDFERYWLLYFWNKEETEESLKSLIANSLDYHSHALDKEDEGMDFVKVYTTRLNFRCPSSPKHFH